MGEQIIHKADLVPVVHRWANIMNPVNRNGTLVHRRYDAYALPDNAPRNPDLPEDMRVVYVHDEKFTAGRRRMMIPKEDVISKTTDYSEDACYRSQGRRRLIERFI